MKKILDIGGRSTIGLHALQLTSKQIGLLTFHPFFLLLLCTDVEQREKEGMVSPAPENNPHHKLSIKHMILLADSIENRSRHHHDKHRLILIVSLIQDIIHLVDNTLHDIRQLQYFLDKIHCRKIQLGRSKLRILLVMKLSECIHEDNEYII